MDTIIGTDIEKARVFLQQGELVAIPTETVYGLAANALSPAAVIKIFEAKNRPTFNPLIVHFASWQAATHYVDSIPAKAELLATALTPGPITFLLKKKEIIPDLVTAGSEKVAIRIPNHPLTTQLLGSLEFPLAAPSANPFGYISPTTAQHVYDNLQGKIPYILDGGPASVGLESTIVGFDDNDQVILYRSGGISTESIETILGERLINASLIAGDKPVTAGQLSAHYAPHTPLFRGDILPFLAQHPGKKVAVISFKTEVLGLDKNWQFVLSPAGSLNEAASNLFAVLRKIDQLQADLIVAEPFPDQGIGRAINDRLNRAGAAHQS